MVNHRHHHHHHHDQKKKKKKPRGRFEKEEEGGGGGDLVKCSGKYCRSCCGGYIADCVAVCCCPCWVLHCFVLAIVKGPCVLGRKCLGLGKKKKNMKSMKNEKKEKGYDYEDVVIERNIGRNVKMESNNSSNVFGSIGDVNAGFDAEKVWKELYQIGHLDFGRVSSSHED